MKRNTQIKIANILVLMLALVLISSSSFAGVYYLRAEETTKTMPDSEVITMWGFAPDVDMNFAAITNAAVPGPFLSVDTDDPNLTIYLKNNLSVPVSIVIPGLITSMTPQFFTDSEGRRRVRSLTHETQPDAIGVYTWPTLKDGSFIYESGTHQAVQVQMGLYGGLGIEPDPNEPYTGVSVDYEANLFFSEIDPALHEAVAAGTYSSMGLDPILLSETFDADSGSFGYIDDAFRGTSQASYASGSYEIAGGFTGGGLKVDLGGVDNTAVSDMSGAWNTDFTLLANSNVTVSFRYNLTQATAYESNEYCEALVAIDGTLYGSGGNDYQAKLTGDGSGGPDLTTGWQLVNIDLGTVSSGIHTLTIGAYNNKKTAANESSEILIDDVVITRVAIAAPATMTSTINYDPKYFLINGSPYTQAALPLAAGGIGEDTLLRFYNAGLETHYPLVQGLYMDIIAEDGYMYPYSKQQYSLTLPAGTTIDALIINPAVEKFYPVYDRSLNLTNAADTSGGMLAFLNVGNSNIPPVITSISATPSFIFDGNTSQLSVSANDPESSPLSYDWLITSGGGSLDSSIISNPVYTSPGDVVGTDTITVQVTVDDSTDTTVSSVDVTVLGLFLTRAFDADADSFGYIDNAFRGTSQAAYASGSYEIGGGFTGGGLKVDLGGVDNTAVLGMSGAWFANFTLSVSSNVTVSFRYNLTQATAYESDEYCEALVAIDGTLYGSGGNDYQARLTGDGSGGPDLTTGWQLVNLNLGTVSAGVHTLTIGAYNNKKTAANESSEILIDDVVVSP